MPHDIDGSGARPAGTTNGAAIPGATIEEIEKGKTKQADILIKLARAGDLFHAPDGTAFADVNVNDHRETWPIRSKGFRRWLARRFFEATGGAPNSEALGAALNLIEAMAQFDGAERAVHVRLAEHEDRIYLDLADEKWRAVEIDANGWRVIASPPVRFRRPAGMKPLPIPERGGSLAALRRFANVASEEDFVLLVAWLLAALRPGRPCPVLVLTGEQGSAKSSLAALLRALVDPNTVPLRSLPREDRDLFIAANNGHVIAIDNVSSLPPWLSDALARIATGGGFSTRTLYSDDEETLLAALRPIILNGIEDFVTRADLADRAVFLRLEAIPEEKRRPEAELRTQFEAVQPSLIGVFCEALAHGLAALPRTRLSRLPRMADFAIWATACEGALWPAGTFGAAYECNRAEANETVIEADGVAIAARALVPPGHEWSGSATQLLAALAEKAGEAATRAKFWPGTARALSGRLRRAAPNLRRLGVDILFEREGHGRNRTITITAAAPDKEGAQPSAPSAPSAETGEIKRGNGLAANALRTQNGGADASTVRGDATVRPTVRGNPLEHKAADGADGADAKIPALSGSGGAEGAAAPNGAMRPLIAIADEAGGGWPECARAAAIELTRDSEDSGSARVLLLGDLRELFEAEPNGVLFTNEILAALHKRDDRPWPEYRHGKPITARQVAALLAPLKIAAGTVRRATETAKGYRADAMADAFARYLTPAQSVTPSQPAGTLSFSRLPFVTFRAGVTDEIPLRAAESATCDGVTDKNLLPAANGDARAPEPSQPPPRALHTPLGIYAFGPPPRERAPGEDADPDKPPPWFDEAPAAWDAPL
ncbi:MAG: DUF3631 domain-containing protein [Stellaceae bacterium]